MENERPRHGEERNRRTETHSLGEPTECKVAGGGTFLLPGPSTTGTYVDQYCRRCDKWVVRKPGILSMIMSNLCCPECGADWNDYSEGEG